MTWLTRSRERAGLPVTQFGSAGQPSGESFYSFVYSGYVSGHSWPSLYSCRWFNTSGHDWPPVSFSEYNSRRKSSILCSQRISNLDSSAPVVLPPAINLTTSEIINSLPGCTRALCFSCLVQMYADRRCLRSPPIQLVLIWDLRCYMLSWTLCRFVRHSGLPCSQDPARSSFRILLSSLYTLVDWCCTYGEDHLDQAV